MFVFSTYLSAKLYMENAGSPVTSLYAFRKDGSLFITSAEESSVVKVSNKMSPWHRGWQGSLKSISETLQMHHIH